MKQSYNVDFEQVAKYFANGERQLEMIATKHGLSVDDAINEVENRKLRY